MRTLPLLLLALVLGASPGSAGDPSTGPIPTKGDDHIRGVPYDGHPAGGDTIETALVVPEIFTLEGNTCGFADDYDEACPYDGSSSPDAVYVCHAAQSLDLQIDLCDAGYDTKLYVYDFEGGHGFGNPLACSDDACGVDLYRSRVVLSYEAGRTYYIVVDGFGGDCGDYTLRAYEISIPDLDCPPGAVIEGEPDCHDGYLDLYNAGCNAEPAAFTGLTGSPEGGTIVVCGTSGTFVTGGGHIRDTDWYELQVAADEVVTFDAMAEFPLQILLIDGNAGCAGFKILTVAGAEQFGLARIVWPCEPGTYWLWVGPSVFTGVPCGSRYIAYIDGFTGGATPPAPTTWGALKSRFR